MILHVTDGYGRQYEAEVESYTDQTLTGVKDVTYDIDITGRVGRFSYTPRRAADEQEVLEGIFEKIRSAVDGWSKQPL